MGAQNMGGWSQPKHNWYTCYDPVGPHGNVHHLILNKTEFVAGSGAQAIATALGAASVTLKKLHKGGKKT